ncbi:hypothetical protein EWM64_g4796 [Hericium alpestre]|uniref:Uncharacterized protein n=1 Tax=Hericium alpestre TaxID=135208 RepID=A0A4Y9ZWL4_9AGAM|nr:hypothetical protein EWM64_g4796 [Hericium alpestre]
MRAPESLAYLDNWCSVSYACYKMVALDDNLQPGQVSTGWPALPGVAHMQLVADGLIRDQKQHGSLRNTCMSTHRRSRADDRYLIMRLERAHHVNTNGSAGLAWKLWSTWWKAVDEEDGMG